MRDAHGGFGNMRFVDVVLHDCDSSSSTALGTFSIPTVRTPSLQALFL